jgi:hypothetical protein
MAASLCFPPPWGRQQSKRHGVKRKSLWTNLHWKTSCPTRCDQGLVVRDHVHRACCRASWFACYECFATFFKVVLSTVILQAKVARKKAVCDALARTGTYEHTFSELQWGARVAWRNHSKSAHRSHWNELMLLDHRSADTPAKMFEARLSMFAVQPTDARVSGPVASSRTVFLSSCIVPPLPRSRPRISTPFMPFPLRTCHPAVDFPGEQSWQG